jgi:ubiquinol-cytochrome c reductase cytochrome b subunit
VPSPDHAYDSIQFVNHRVAGGALLRGIHHWGASAVVVLVIAHMVRVFAIGAYKYPREANWAIGVALFVVVMGFAFTGYLLPWDQRAYWATVVGTSVGGAAPLVGEATQALLRGGAAVGAATLTRFFAFHVLWFPALVGGLVLLHLVLVVYHGWSPPPAELQEGAPPSTGDERYPEYYRQAYAAAQQGEVRVWPDLMARAAVSSLGVVTAIVLLAAGLGAGLEPPADPTDAAYVPMPEWYFLPLYELMKVVPNKIESVVSLGMPAALVIALLALPFFDRSSMRSLRQRPAALASVAILLGGAGLLIGAAVRGSVAQGPEPAGAPLTSTQRAGRALFRSQCLSCHIVAGEGGQIGPDLSDVGLRHSGPWMHSFIEEPSRFHRDTRMMAFGPPRLTHQEIEAGAAHLAPGGAALRSSPSSRTPLGRSIAHEATSGPGCEAPMAPDLLTAAIRPSRGGAGRASSISSGVTHPGKVRAGNQDTFWCAPCTCKSWSAGRVSRPRPGAARRAAGDDDARGREWGRKADVGSQLPSRRSPAVSSTMRCFRWRPGRGRVLGALRAAALEAHAAVRAEAAGHSESKGMATTLTLALFVWPQMYVMQVGDSRCYYYLDGVLRQVTRDQTLAQALVDRGVVPPDEVADSPYRNVLASSIGGSEAAPEVTRLDLNRRAVALLCSDGLTKHVSDQEIAGHVRGMESSEQLCRTLLDLALERGGSDNITVLVARARGTG